MLGTRDGPYESWPSRTHVLVGGVRPGLAVSGYVPLRQFEAPAAYLLVAGYDCPFEKAVTFTLASKDPLKVRAAHGRCPGHATSRRFARGPASLLSSRASHRFPADSP
ncbi:hypothetical protein [Burkholderia pyrrocinia]|uniref:hypothetical protein n=1 Tax=Burkholderia pyrrocinia TaxID=60550 RepID=UPI002AB1EF9B|nr:hypothetical protein [Burkholderia pyrrocinia]